ncbi:MAG TPA: FAD-dependent oxidoreductase [Kiritimatiellia bacterium]|nr:FAD-dependent oxidoreductase [Kiritimatiellia bacterium]
MSKSTIILGAGLTGLGVAKHLPGSVIYEAKEHVGGHVYSHEQSGIHYDEGAHICHARDEEWKKQLFDNAGDVVHIRQSLVSNWWHGHWLTYPVQNHLRDLPPDLRDRALNEIVHAQEQTHSNPPANYDAWCRRQYGDFLADRFYREYTEKYWRTSMSEMDIDWLAGRLLPSQLERIKQGAFHEADEKQSVFSEFYYPARGGFFAFFEKFYRDVDVRCGHKVSGLRLKDKTITFTGGEQVHYDRCISTIPLPDLIQCMDDVPDAIRSAAKTLRHTQMLVVNMVVNKPALVPHHWFYIYDSDIDVSRVKVMSNLIPESMPSGKTVLQTEIFRRDDETLDVEPLKRKAVIDMGYILGFDSDREVDRVDHIVVSHSYTIPTLGRQAAVDCIAEWLESKDIITAGLYGRWKYVWSDQAYAAGKEVAEKVN